MDSQLWDARYAAADLVWSAGPNATVAALTADLPPGRALDVAAGEGRNAIWLAERGWDADALDFSRVGLDRAERIAADRLAVAGVTVITGKAQFSSPHNLTITTAEGSSELAATGYDLRTMAGDLAALTDAEYAASRSEQSLSIPAMNLVTGHVLLVLSLIHISEPTRPY